MSATFVAWFAFGAALAHGSPVFDREFSLERVGVLKPYDNADQVFAEITRAAYEEYFTGHSRFRYQDLSKTDSILTGSKIPYSKLVEDKQVLQKVGQSLKLNSLIRTKIFKQPSFYEVQMDWINLPRGELLASEVFTVQEPAQGLVGFPDKFKSEIQSGIDRMLKRLPFLGQVTGVDEEWVTVGLGAVDGLNKGDSLIVSTIEEVKRHPLLQKVVDWRFERVGVLKVEDIDRHLAFCKIVEKEEKHEFSILQKITAVIPANERLATLKNEEAQEKTDDRFDRPRTGWVSGGLGIGLASRSYENVQTGLSKEGTGFNVLGRVEGQLWLTKHWFTELAVFQGFYGYSQKDVATGLESPGTGSSGTMTRFRINGGYTFFGTPDFFGPRGWIKLGYQRTSHNLASNAAEYLSSVSFGGMFLGLGGDLPLRPKWGIMAELDFMVFASSTEELAFSGASTSASDTLFSFGVYYWLQNRLKLNLNFELITQGSDYETNAKLTHRSMTFVPSLQYYF